MARIKISLEPTTGFIAQLDKWARIRGSQIWARRALAGSVIISREIGTMLVQIFENTDVAKALRGQGSEDLPAHFGLSNSTANSLVDGMAELIQSSVRILSQDKGGVVSLRIQAVEKDWDKYLSIPGAQYISHPSNVTIPVIKWLLVNPNIDIGQAAYDIVFEGEGKNFDARIHKISRSGRAIMVSLKTLGGSGGYVLPSIVSGQIGQNFIEMTLGQSDVAVKAAAILMKRVK
jgi:hypothetical protein